MTLSVAQDLPFPVSTSVFDVTLFDRTGVMGDRLLQTSLAFDAQTPDLT